MSVSVTPGIPCVGCGEWAPVVVTLRHLTKICEPCARRAVASFEKPENREAARKFLEATAEAA